MTASTKIPQAQTFASVYNEMVALADEHLTRPFTATVDAWEDGEIRIRVYHVVAGDPDHKEQLYYHSDGGEIRYAITDGDEIKDERVVREAEPAEGSV